MSEAERLCEQIEEACDYLAQASEREGAEVWQTIDAPKGTTETGAWLFMSGGDAVDLTQKCLRAMYLAYSEGKEQRLVYNTETGRRVIKSESEDNAKAERTVAVMRPDVRPLPPEKAAEKVDSCLKDFRPLFVKQLQTIAFAERELRRNAAVQRVS